MGKVLIFLYDTMAGFEMSLAAYLLGRYSGREVIGIGYEKGPVRDVSGIMFSPTMTVSEALALPDIEGLIIPGGFASDYRPELQALIQRLDSEQHLLAAICAGPFFLAKAGALNGRRYTTTLRDWTDDVRKTHGDADPFPRETFVDSRCVRDGHVITAHGHAFSEFAVEVADWFGVFPSPADRAEYLAAVRGPGGVA